MEKKDTRYLLNYRNLKHSLEGEEGVLEFILSQIPKIDRDNFVVEFGALDGVMFSNSLHFIKKYDFESIQIEADVIQFKKLELNMKPYNVECINSFIVKDQNSKDSLDNILKNSKKKVPTNFDLLTIDIDNNDYHIWKSLEGFKPKIVMIEINNTLLPTADKIAKYDAEFIFGKHGSSIKSITELANKKGYKLICNISCNAIYVQEKYFNLFFDYEPKVEDFYTFEGIHIKNGFFALSIKYKLIKFFEAIRRDKAIYNRNTLLTALNIIKNLFKKNV